MIMKRWHRLIAYFGALMFIGPWVDACADGVRSPYEFRAAYEPLCLPEGESMGMAGLGLERSYDEHFSAGVGSWMAVHGKRGGFITIGFQGSAHLSIAGSTGVEVGAFVGAGGGRGEGYSLSGSGLMIRGYVGLTEALSSSGRIGVGISYTGFPNGGSIDSVQPVVLYQLPVDSGLHRFDGLAFGESSLTVVTRLMRVDSGVHDITGNVQGDITLLGIEWRSAVDDNLFVRLETDGAAGGSSSGYMQILLGGGARIPLWNTLWIDGSVSLGGGGGGGVDTGGGLLVDLSGGVQYLLSEQLVAGTALSWLVAPDGNLSGLCPSLKVGGRFGGASLHAEQQLPVRIRIVTQQYTHGAEGWRSAHSESNVENLGVQFDYFPVSWGYLTGQALAAYDGHAGAYMIGLFGGGLHQKVVGPVFAEVEGLAGAAGGGGLVVGSGLVWQANTGIGLQVTRDVALLMTAGHIDALSGPFAADVFGLSMVIGGQ
ncbi:MAG: hypothetical protein HGA97_04080 [Chlorobiaceae bacterium]|nr:hypothetical protein [Chlorobiaceae bacterium]